MKGIGLEIAGLIVPGDHMDFRGQLTAFFRRLLSCVRRKRLDFSAVCPG